MIVIKHLVQIEVHRQKVRAETGKPVRVSEAKGLRQSLLLNIAAMSTTGSKIFHCNMSIIQLKQKLFSFLHASDLPLRRYSAG